MTPLCFILLSSHSVAGSCDAAARPLVLIHPRPSADPLPRFVRCRSSRPRPVRRSPIRVRRTVPRAGPTALEPSPEATRGRWSASSRDATRTRLSPRLRGFRRGENRGDHPINDAEGTAIRDSCAAGRIGISGASMHGCPSLPCRGVHTAGAFTIGDDGVSGRITGERVTPFLNRAWFERRARFAQQRDGASYSS